MRQRRQFDPFSTVLLDHEEGSTTVIRSPDWQDLPWRCQVRWSGGGWTSVVAVEVGWLEADGWPSLDSTEGYGEVVASDSTGVGATRSLTPDQAHLALSRALEGARSLEMSRKVAVEARRFIAAKLDPDYAGIVGRAQGLGDTLLNHAEAVASIYQLLVDNGAEDPTQRMADLMDRSRATAARRISAARKKGLLGPARRGRAGSIDDETVAGAQE